MNNFGICVFCLFLATAWPAAAASQAPAPLPNGAEPATPSAPPASSQATTANPQTPDARPMADTGWITMPPGARATYMGIHGGTMPVSLLVAGDGASLVSFVGRTGNDFLEILRRTDVRVPSLLNATVARSTANSESGQQQHNVSSLTAGSADGGMPVISSGNAGKGRNIDPSSLQPFGLSDKPLLIEGQASKPLQLSPVKRYRLFFQPQYLQPRRGSD